MILARVKGSVVSTLKHESHHGHKLLVVQPVDNNGDDLGSSFLAFDSVSAGVGDVVLVQQEGNCAREMLGEKTDPFHSVIAGIVDQVRSENV